MSERLHYLYTKPNPNLHVTKMLKTRTFGLKPMTVRLESHALPTVRASHLIASIPV